MKSIRPIHPDFEQFLFLKPQSCIDLFIDLRNYVLELYPEANELLYHTHALTAVFSISEKLSDAFCMIPIYTKHLNLGFNKGTLLYDPKELLEGTGKLIRHIPVSDVSDYRNPEVKSLLKAAIDLAISEVKKPSNKVAQTISKIKK
ncbi:DUF1801 domain-containing protein [Kordia algicida OT-1]|uniref:Uncharacterized protein n=1 Tax=Kordia algicida OT-1 TaxID=391587 RepID=A9E512_9FLAO|nr:DUF1801 domain-containing protein [Kordia algicida]EDP95135.1 hypothetical protein KAOT1_06617 [Kordia algicida OT-1]